MSVGLNYKPAFYKNNDKKDGYYLGTAPGSVAKGAVAGATIGAVAALANKTGRIETIDNITIGGLKKIAETATSDELRTINAGVNKLRKSIKKAVNPILDEMQEAKTKYIADNKSKKALIFLKKVSAKVGEAAENGMIQGRKAMIKVFKGGTAPIAKYTGIGAVIGAVTLLTRYLYKKNNDNA